MEEKKETKKKPWQRWKAKPLVNLKSKTLKEKVSIVKELEKKLPEEDKKSIKKKSNPKWWRPTVMTPRVVDKLKLCFSVWMSDEQACYFCEISTDALYKYQRENPKFIKEKAILKESITMQARVNIWRSIKAWSVGDSWKWVEKKDPSFQNVIKIEWDLNVSDKSRALLKKLALEE